MVADEQTYQESSTAQLLGEMHQRSGTLTHLQQQQQQ
jgi:hypothetical protein